MLYLLNFLKKKKDFPLDKNQRIKDNSILNPNKSKILEESKNFEKKSNNLNSKPSESETLKKNEIAAEAKKNILKKDIPYNPLKPNKLRIYIFYFIEI